MKNWKTTSMGILVIIGAIVSVGFDLFNKTFTQEGLMLQIGSILTGIGLLVGADAGTPPPPPKTT